MSCTDGYRKNRKSTCVKNCREDQYLSEKTDRCILKKSYFPSRLSKTLKQFQKHLLKSPSSKNCHSGYIKNKIGRCSKDCRSDQFRDPLTDRCKVREKPNYYAKKKQMLSFSKRFFRPTEERTKYTRRYTNHLTKKNNNNNNNLNITKTRTENNPMNI